MGLGLRERIDFVGDEAPGETVVVEPGAQGFVALGRLVARVDFAARMGVAVTPEFQKR